MKDLVKVNKKAGKQNKKKWMKVINTDGLMGEVEKNNTSQLRTTFKKPVIIEEISKKYQPLDPNRFKRKDVDPKLQSITQKNIIRRINLDDIQANKRKKAQLADPLEDVWDQPIKAPERHNTPRKTVQQQDLIQTPAIMTPQGGQSYNPSAQEFERLVDKIVQVEGEKQKRVIIPKEKKIRKVLMRTRNRAVRKEQLDARERKKQRIRQHHENDLKLVEKTLDRETQKGIKTTQENLQKKREELAQRKTGWITKGPALVKSRRYQYKQDIIPGFQTTELSKMPFRDSIIRDRIDSVYRRSMLEPKNYTANPKLKKGIKVRPARIDDRPFW